MRSSLCSVLPRLGRRILSPHGLPSMRQYASEVPSIEALQQSVIYPDRLSESVDDAMKHYPAFNPEPYTRIEDMFDAGIWHGHKIGTLKDNMKWALYGERLGTCIIDLDITKKYFDRSLEFLAHCSFRGAIVLFVSTHKDNMHMIERMAAEVGEFSHTRKWEAGTFTNMKQLFKSPLRLPDVVIFLNTVITNFDQHPGIIESAKMTIPTIGIIDTDTGGVILLISILVPNYVTYPIPGNDDTPRAVEFYMKAFCAAIKHGKAAREKYLASRNIS